MGKWATYAKRGGHSSGGVIEQYQARLLAAGGSIDATGLTAVTALYTALALTGVWDRLIDIWPCCGADLTSVMVKLKVAPGAPSSYTNVNFVGGDYNQTGGSGGLLGNGSTKYLSGGPTIDDLQLDCSMFFSLLAYTPNAGNRAAMGALNGGNQWWFGALDGTASRNGRLGGTALCSTGSILDVANWTLTRSSSVDMRMYRNSVQDDLQTGVATTISDSTRCGLFAYNSVGTPLAFFSGRLAGAAFGRSLNSGQVASLAAAWAAFNLLLSR